MAAADGLWQAARRWESRISDGFILALLVVVALVERVPRLGIRYWGDEAISVGIAGRPLHEIPHYLGFDGSPPLWYVLLHWWMAAFGHSEVATHSFSLLVSLVAIPVAWWCADVLFSRRAARAAALLAAVSPYLTYYGTETRMYALLGVLSMVAVTATIRYYREPASATKWRGGGWRGDPSLRWLALAVVASDAVLYTHNWGLFLIGVLFLSGLLGVRRRGDRTRLRRVVGYGAAVGLGYLPWVPSFVSQLRNTGAPWAARPHLIDLIVDPFNVSFSAAWWVVVAALITAFVVKQATYKGPRWTWSTAAISPLSFGAFIVVGTVFCGWIASQFVHAWAPRYVGVAAVPALVVLGAFFTEHRIGRRFLLVVAVSLAATTLPVLTDPGAFADSKSNVAAVDQAVRPHMAPGDLVVTALAELPIIAYYLPAGLRYATPLGVVSDPRVIDWKHLPTRLQAAVPTRTLAAVLASVPVGGHVLVINPVTFAGTQAATQYAQTVSAEEVALNQDIIVDPDFQSVLFVRPHDVGAIANPVEGILYVRTGLPPAARAISSSVAP